MPLLPILADAPLSSSFIMVGGLLSIPGLFSLFTRRLRRRRDQGDEIRQQSMGSTAFFGSQVGGQSVINYSYTDLPWKLLAYDVRYFFQFAWALPWILFPLRPCDSGDLDELSFTRQNVFCILIHFILSILQIAFILSLPFTILFPIWMVSLYLAAFFAVNYLFCLMLNGRGVEYHSDERYAARSDEHAHEQWIFLNGVAVGEHWMQNNLNRLALTFKRPILGIHNQTSGIIFDVVECLIQRNFGYATYDVRICYKRLKQTLYDPQFSKVVFILHSQGGIEGGLVLDWLLQELPQDLLCKLEVYTFGNAANHFNNPHRHVLSQKIAQSDPAAAVSLTTTTTTQATPISSPISPLTANGLANGLANGNGHSTSGPSHPPSLHQESSLSTTTQTSSAAQDRAIGHVEHYAHTTDFVAMWGVLHFCTSLPASHAMPRFIGRLFVRASDRGGHQFCQHYLDGMFPLSRDSETGQFTGAAEENDFMESLVQVGEQGGAGQNVREAFEITWNGAAGFGSGVVPPEVEVHGDPGGRGRRRDSVVKVKDLSRLWLYRNGGSPPEPPPLLISENGFVRNATM